MFSRPLCADSPPSSPIFQRLVISKTLTLIIKRERLWDRINRVMSAHTLRALASMHVQQVAAAPADCLPSVSIAHSVSLKVEKLRFEFESTYSALCSASGCVIDSIQKWHESYERALPFVWRGEDYMGRMLGQVRCTCCCSETALRLLMLCAATAHAGAR
jgi:hypothetical protein